MRRILAVAAAVAFALAGFAHPAPVGSQDEIRSYNDYARAAVATLLGGWLDDGRWRMCSGSACPKRNQDWGADALTADLLLRWETTRDPQLLVPLRALERTAPHYGEPCRDNASCEQWSDVPAWDAVAAAREYLVTADPEALAHAEAAYRVVAGATVYARGACPDILYQLPWGGTNRLKTLETDANLVRAALLLHGITGERTYLDDAIARYGAIRARFLDPQVPLYSVYVFDDGGMCRQLRRRFFASVNGIMILAGLGLAQATGEERYRDDALATATAVDERLSDDRGVYANLQAENDIGEPLVEAMYALATRESRPFARAWLLRNAEAAVAARNAAGSYGRFFDGPPPRGVVTAWQTNAGFALVTAAAAVAPDVVPRPQPWGGARFIPSERSSLPTVIRFSGSAIALIGTIGDRCCEAGHARIFIDGQETFDRRGIWQNKSCSGAAVEHGILFAWQWPENGVHTLRIDEGERNAKEGGSYLHLEGYLVR